MSDSLIPEVGNVSLDLVIRIQAASQPPAAKKTEKSDSVVEASAQRQEKALAAVDAKQQDGSKSMLSLADVSLKFMINADTKDVTILILDRASHKVVRTIPPEDMNRMDPGELLQLFA
jgi:uncharacterized FlaG/YvyC family protein